MLNALTIDLEDYFQVHAFSKVIPYQDWEKYESRVERNAHRILEILSESIANPQSAIRGKCSATFFVLGWIAERYSGLIREIQREGHEVASHGYNHQVISSMSSKEFREDVRRSKSILEDLTGEAVIGYRAPTFSINKERFWALRILAEEGYRYDSSIFPISHDNYGVPDAPRFPFRILMNGNGKVDFLPISLIPGGIRPAPLTEESAVPDSAPAPWVLRMGPPASDRGQGVATFHRIPSAPDPSSSFLSPQGSDSIQQSVICNPPFLVEFPLSTICFLRRNFPISGGGYFRLLPYRIITKALKRINKEEEQPFIFYLHPWEIDAEQPRIKGAGMKSKFRHYVNLRKTEGRFRKLVDEFHFSSIRKVIQRYST